MPFTALYTTGIHQEIFNFDSVEEKNSWEMEVLKIKAESATAYNKKEQDGLTGEIRVLYQQWIDHVKTFSRDFGEDRVPQDIKWALNTAEEAFDLGVTQWNNPPNNSIFKN